LSDSRRKNRLLERDRLSLRCVRELLGPEAPELDDQLLKIRDALYDIVEVWVERAISVGTMSSIESSKPTDAEHLIEIEERAAILQFDGGLSQAESERVALEMYARNSKEPMH